ncbi:hypothetical protein COU54_05370 [Candidatus Pacearchaeota archaeon CG10_big_fil_rev_8_21_14_0_10_31_24]|nr:MAG: hypothetical protein COU54_05370 [Candidatus Pacearchaeota archaeon CG10_big_fil_rev_8_21_14_0_10_31_24]
MKGIVNKSKISGKGVFADRDLKKGELFCEMEGKLMTIPELLEKCDSGEEEEGYPFQIDDLNYLDLDDPYMYINHSCNPNLGIKEEKILFVLKDIKEGEEVTFDYSSSEWSSDTGWGEEFTEPWDMECSCGNENCRKIVTEFPQLPEEIKIRYEQLGALPSFILKKIGK